MSYHHNIESRMVKDVQHGMSENIHLAVENYDYISESPVHFKKPNRTGRIMECLVSSLHHNIYCEPRVTQYSASNNSAVSIAPIATHIMQDLVTMECLNWSLHQNTAIQPRSLHLEYSPNGVTLNDGHVAATTTISVHNLDMLASAALLEMTERGFSDEASSLETDFASTFTARSRGQANAMNSGRKIGRIRRYNKRIAAYSAWTDIYAGEDTGQKNIDLNRGGRITVYTNMISCAKKSSLSKAMHQCNLYRQYTRSQVFHEPRFHVLLSSKAGRSNVGYKYHGIQMKAHPINFVPEVASYATELARMYNLPQDQWDIGVDLIIYRDGDDSIGWHADDTQGESVILCVVVDAPGEPRPIHIRPNKRVKHLADGDEEIQLLIGEGDGYDMDGMMQQGYEHCLPKRNGDTAHRFVLIFRHGIETRVSEDTGVALAAVSEYPQIAMPDSETGCLASFLSRIRAKAPLVSFGHPQKVLEGSYYSRRFLFSVNAHRADQRGINGNMKIGSDSIVVSRQSLDLREEDGGGALCLSYTKQHPIRVFRSSNLNSEFAPPELGGGQTSYRYDGLYVVTKVWDSLGNEVYMNNDGIPAGGTQFTFHLDRIPKMGSDSATSSDSIYNTLNLQELWEKILLSHGHEHRLLFKPPRAKFVDKLPIIWNAQRVEKSKTLHTDGLVPECSLYQRGAREEVGETIDGCKRSKICAGASIRNLVLNGEGMGKLRPSLSRIIIRQSVPANMTEEEQERQKRQERQEDDENEANVAVVPRSEIWLPIDNFSAWHTKKKEQWRKKRMEMDCNFADSKSIIKHFRFINGKGRLRPSLSQIATRQTIQEKIQYIQYWRNLTREEQEQQRKDAKEAKVAKRNSKKRKRREKVEESIVMSLDAVEEIEVFLHSVILMEYWTNFIQLTDNANRHLEIFANRFLRNICEDSPGDNAMAIIRRTLMKRESLPPSHRLVEVVPQLRSNQRERVPTPEPRIDEPPARQRVVRFTTNAEEGTQSISQPLEAMICANGRKNTLFKQVKVSVKWRIQSKSRKKSLHGEGIHPLHYLIKHEKSKMSQIIIKPNTTTRHSVVRFNTDVQEGIQSIAQPLDALFCVNKAKKTFRHMKVTVKWGIASKKSQKKSACDVKKSSCREKITADTSTTRPSTTFDVNEKVFAWDRNYLYEATIVKVKYHKVGCVKHLVHYVGYPKSHDRWLTSNAILKDNPKVRTYFDEQI